MMLPNAVEARVPEDKIVKYLLSATHRAGKSKAAFFARFGFTVQRWEELAAALERHARENPVAMSEVTAFGTRYVVDGTLVAPDGAALNVRSVWFISHEKGAPRFATAHPLKRKAA
jgi:hypothetical protein